MKLTSALGLLSFASAVEVVITDVGTYPGYSGQLDIEGEVKIDFTTAGAKLFWNVVGVESECAQADPDAANSCGIHIHEGFSCDDANAPGGHYYDADTIAFDPWGAISYQSTGSKSVGEAYVEYGFGYESTKNRVLVLHDRTGARVTCAVIPANPYVNIKPLGEYPGYSGDVQVKGAAELFFEFTSVTIFYELDGVEPECSSPSSAANSCGIHIHQGTGCEDPSLPGGHYYNSDRIRDDPWATVVYTADGDKAKGQVKVDYGYLFESTEGRVLVVHDRSGARVTCAIIVDTYGGVTVPDVGTYPDYSGALEITGSAQLEFVGEAVTINYKLEGVEPECSSPDTSAANSCGIHIHEGYSCYDASIPGGHYFNSDKIPNDPWSPAVYKATGTSATGSVEVKYGYNKETTLGRVLVVHDRSGARVTCAVLRTNGKFENVRSFGRKDEKPVEAATE